LKNPITIVFFNENSLEIIETRFLKVKESIMKLYAFEKYEGCEVSRIEQQFLQYGGIVY